MALLLRYNAGTSVPVDLSVITPDKLRAQSHAEIERITVRHGNRTIALAELFSVEGNASDGSIEFDGNLSGVHSIGAGMSSGVIRLHGDAGRHLGSQMSGGEIHAEGNVEDGLGAEMSGGVIKVKGNAGDGVGSAYPGSRRGMTDGTILIGGNAGSEVGSKMRRGMIAIRGSCGPAPGLGMIAGSVLVFGNCGIRAGAGMARGTLGLFGAEVPELLPTFSHAGQFRPVFLPLIFRELARLGFDVPQTVLDDRLTLYRGDRLVQGKGEIWMKRPSFA